MNSNFLSAADADLAKAIEHLQTELAGLQIGRASASIVETLPVEVYGAHQPLKNLANISVPDAKTLFIEPWDKSTLRDIEKAITESSLGLNPNNDGQRIILNIPPLTEERRRDLTKVVGQKAEDAKISVRHVREELRKKGKAAKEAEEMTEDDLSGFEKKLQEKVDETNKKIEEMSSKKEEEIMKI